MHRRFFLFLAALALTLVGGACTKPIDTSAPVSSTGGDLVNSAPAVNGTTESPPGPPTPSVAQPVALVDLPIAEYAARRTLKAHGEYIKDRFTGYHVGDDIEYADARVEVPVRSIVGGTVLRAERVSGYGGFVSIEHTVSGQTVVALYGHLDLGSVTLRSGDAVTKGQVIGQLGDGETAETDGERKHLHFALYEPTGIGDRRMNGYESSSSGLARWLNPTDFFTSHGQPVSSPTRTFIPATDRGGSVFKVRFAIPSGMEIEYVPSLEALNIFTVAGSGTARERSQIFLRTFAASSFLILSTVTIHSTETITVGQGRYDARRYDIEKKAGVADFADQPSWRSTRHFVTDFHQGSGHERYYVVAANPALDPAVYQQVLDSMVIE